MEENKKNEIINGMIDSIKRIVKTEKIEERTYTKYKKYFFTVDTESKEKITDELDAIKENQIDVKSEEEWNWSEQYGWYKEEQIISHLEKFKKVLYTNGLEFYFLTLEEVKEQITIMKLADLSSVYNRYLEHNEKYIELKDDAEEQWNDLIDGLTSIDWHQPPVAEIPSI